MMKRVRVTNEFKRYIARMQSYIGGRDPVKLMAAQPARLERAVRGLSRAQLNRQPRPGKWSIQEIVAHLADTELVYGWRLRMMLAQPGLPIQPTDQDLWAKRLGYQRQPTSKLLKQLRVLRESNVRLLRWAPRKWWSRYGVHLQRGKENVTRTVEMWAGHDVNHLNQISAIRRQFGW
jgi:hypothetical protein